MDELTPDQQRQLRSKLWTELRAEVRYPTAGSIPFWDLPLNPKRKRSTTVAVKCGRCDGKGAIASFSVRYSGVCFACGGSGFRLIPRSRWEALKAKRAAIKELCQ